MQGRQVRAEGGDAGRPGRIKEQPAEWAPGAESHRKTREDTAQICPSEGRRVGTLPHQFPPVHGWRLLSGMLIPRHSGQRSGKSSFLRFWTKLSGAEMQIPTVLPNNAPDPGLTPRAPETEDTGSCDGRDRPPCNCLPRVLSQKKISSVQQTLYVCLCSTWVFSAAGVTLPGMKFHTYWSLVCLPP